MRQVLLVMFVLLVLAAPALAETPADVTLSGFVNDYAGVLSADEKAVLERDLQAIFDSGTAQVAIVTVANLGGQDIGSFSYQVAEGKLGDSMKNNGLLLLIAVDDHRYRFEVGRGLEPVFNDARIGRIGRTYLVPAFREGEYGVGLGNAVRAIVAVLANETDSSFYASDAQNDQAPSWMTIMILVFVIFWLGSWIAGIAGAVKQARKRRPDDHLFAAAVAAAFLRGGKGGGGFSGGGGFGGGSFGGGGASGGW